MPDPATPLIIPSLANIYATFAPIAEASLRAITGFALVPHGLRMTFGCFAGTGLKVDSLKSLAEQLDNAGYRPGWLWAPANSVTELLCGPLFAVGLFTRLMAVPIFIFLMVSNVERWRVGGYFWNTQGLEYTAMWTVAVFYFLIHGGGFYALDHFLIGWEI